MKANHSTLKIKRGDALSLVKEKLDLISPPDRLPDPDKLIYFYHLSELGFWVFFDESEVVYSIRFEYPYTYAIDGIYIGDTKERVSEVLGNPERYLPVPDGKNHWVYYHPQMIRIDFNSETNRVERVFR